MNPMHALLGDDLRMAARCLLSKHLVRVAGQKLCMHAMLSYAVPL